MFCLSHLQSLRLDAENSRHYSQSSSSESTGSRSPPETPPAPNWVPTSGENAPVGPIPVSEHHNNSSHHATTAPVSHPAGNAPSMMPSVPERHQRNNRKHSHMMRHKNHIVNGSGPPPGIPQCVSFPPPPPHSQVFFAAWTLPGDATEHWDLRQLSAHAVHEANLSQYLSAERRSHVPVLGESGLRKHTAATLNRKRSPSSTVHSALVFSRFASEGFLLQLRKHRSFSHGVQRSNDGGDHQEK